MNKDIEDYRIKVQNWFKKLRDDICLEFETIEKPHNSKFERKIWNREGGGGGEMSVMRGKIFEKVGVNISTVHGEFSSEFSKNIPGTEENPEFWATGISLVAHMQSPLVPAIHMNTRFINTTKWWFGGGMDMTPMYENPEDTKYFHASLKNACDKHNLDYYNKFKEECDRYFYLPHRNEPRGVGGIFYDYMNSGNLEDDFLFTQDVGKAFLNMYPAIVKRNMDKEWTEEMREHQLYKRGRYAEFNLLHDRGTKFGLMTGGNIEAIFMSMPPIAKW